MPNDTCSISRSCVWRVADRLTAAGRTTRPADLCIAITDTGEPCGKTAQVRLGEWEYYGSFGDTVAQPFCTWHASLITNAVIEAARRTKVIDEPITDEEKAEQKRKRAARQGHVYFARRGNVVKIGFTSCLKQRIATLETQSGVRFDEVVTRKGARADEARLHRRFAEHRQIGEWFTVADDIRAMMDKLAA